MAIDPARFGMPDATTTGVQPGITLKPYTGPMTITTDGAVIENVIINGTLTVEADNVTIRNCVFQNFSWWGLLSENANGLRVEYNEFNGAGSTRTSAMGIGEGSNIQITGNDIHGMVIGIQMGSGVTVRGNYIHDLSDTSSNPDDRHFDGITVFRGSNSLIEHNTILMPNGDGGTAAVFISSKFGDINNVTVNNNLLTGNASYTLYSEAASGHTVSGVVVTNNYIERGLYGYVTFVGNNPVYTGNVLWNEGVDPTPYPTAPPDPTLPPPDHTFTGTDGNDVLPNGGQSNAGNDTFYGLGGNDVLSGGAGADWIDGGSGTDTSTYAGSTAGVNVDLAAGTSSGGEAAGDTLTSIENLTGSSHNDFLTGGSGNNVLNGGAGADTMRGGTGDDVYVVDNTGDIVDEGVADSGTETVQSSCTLSLADAVHVFGSVENLTLLGSANINATGNAVNNVITGNSGNNVLNGGPGDDTITGGAGNDTFVFSDALSAANSVDWITDFSLSDDTIQLESAVFTTLTSSASGNLTRGAFYIGAAAHDPTDRIIYNPTTGALTYDSNGNAAGGATQIATLSTGLSLTRSDFEVV